METPKENGENQTVKYQKTRNAIYGVDKKLWIALIVLVVLGLSGLGRSIVIDAIALLIAAALCGGLLFLYFLPAYIGRKKRNRVAIFILNLFLGWTLIGWVISLVWAVSHERQ